MQGSSSLSSWSGFGQTNISQGKNKIPFYKKQINKSSRVILDLFSLLCYDAVDRKAFDEVENNQLPMHAKYFMLHKVFYYANIK